MKEKRNIDELFRERLDSFESSPPPEAWDAIRAALDKKKRRRVIPIWWRVGGVAALLALLLTIGNALFNPGMDSEPLTQQENSSEVLDSLMDGNEAGKTLIDGSDIAGEGDSDASETLLDESSGKDVISGDKRIRTKEDEIRRPGEALAEGTLTKSDQTKQPAGDKLQNTGQTGMASVLPEGKATDKPVRANDAGQPESEDAIDRQNDLLPKAKTGVAVSQEVDDGAKDPVIAAPKTEQEALEEKKESIFEAIAEQEEVREEDREPQSIRDRWEVTPVVGPVYYSSLGEGSSLDPSFADNSQTGEVNFSYGAQISYAITDKLSIRTGLHNVNLGYTTGDIELGTGPVGSALKSVNYGDRSVVTTAVDKGTFQGGAPDSGGGLGGLVPKSAGAEAFINQSLRYFEVPLELRYTFVERRLGVHVVGGFSSLFLTDNEVSVEAGDFDTVLGEANNLNSLSFTTNIGLGFDYKLGKKLKFNIEPMFKYQLNPYNDPSVDFNPFFLGVYSGLSFRF